MNETYKPKEWRVDRAADRDDPLEISGLNEYGDRILIATLGYTNGPEQRDANLIACAPRLLAACQNGLSLLYRELPTDGLPPKEMREMRQALQEALA